MLYFQYAVMAGGVLRFEQVQAKPIELKHWFTVIEDARQLLRSDLDLSLERYVLDSENVTLFNPNAGEILDYEYDIDYMQFDMNRQSPFELFSGRYSPTDYFRIFHEAPLPNSLHFEMFLSNQKSLDKVVDRFMVSRYNFGSNFLGIYNQQEALDTWVRYEC